MLLLLSHVLILLLICLLLWCLSLSHQTIGISGHHLRVYVRLHYVLMSHPRVYGGIIKVSICRIHNRLTHVVIPRIIAIRIIVFWSKSTLIAVILIVIFFLAIQIIFFTVITNVIIQISTHKCILGHVCELGCMVIKACIAH